MKLNMIIIYTHSLILGKINSDIYMNNVIKSILLFRKDWDKYTVSEKETSTSSSIPVGWIIPSESCNSDWSKYSNNFNL